MENINLLDETELSNHEKEQLVVVFAADNNYAMPLSVTILSLLKNLSSERKILFFIIDGGITERNKLRIWKSINNNNKCELRWLAKPAVFEKYNDLLERLPSLQNLPKTAFYRLLISELLPQQFTKAIYLDCDLVINADLGKLWDMELKDDYLLAACTRNVKYVSHSRGLVNWKELGFAQNDKYLSSGVLVFNLERWRSDGMSTKALDYMAHNQQFIRWHDNDILVAIVRDKWGELDLRWNSTEARYMSQEEIDDAYILHYTSPEKPWSVPQSNPSTDLFFHYLRMTDWKGYRQDIPQRLWRRLKREIKQLQKKYFA